MRKPFILIIAACMIAACNSANYRKLDDGIEIHLRQKTGTDAKSIRIQVVSDKIFHIVAVPSGKFPDFKSLIDVDTSRLKAKWSVEEKNDTILLSTSKIKAIVSVVTGRITFLDSSGTEILREDKEGKTFTPVTIDHLATYRIRQVFESPANEAFYGLGQHQYGYMNYKGKDIDLYQYNTKVSVPFVVSNRNYGILWDNYSRSKFGDIREYQDLSSLDVVGSDGISKGLSATYFTTKDTNQVFTRRAESTIDYEVLGCMPKFPKNYNLGNGLVKWSGFVSTDSASEYKFRLYSAGYIKVWFDGKLMADRWRQSWNPTFTFFNYTLEKGRSYPLVIEWIPDGGESYISLKCLPQLPSSEQGKLSLYSEAGKEINYYFIKGDNLNDVIKGYRQVSGKSPLMPKWAMGLWQSRERYKTQNELLSVVKEFRKRQIPFDNIVLDWQYWKKDQWGSQEFDQERFPDPTSMIRDLHNLHSQIMISVWPKFYAGTENYKIMSEKGYLYKKNVEKNTKDWIGYVSTFYDPFNPDARKLFWSMINKNLFSKGIDAWWLDASEPDITSNLSMQERKDLMNPTALGPAEEYFNAFSLVNTEAVYRGQIQTKPDQRVFILTRSAFAGTQRFAAATWSGDVGTRWEELKLQIPAGLNFCLSGIPWWTTDIGGFAVERRYENPTAQDLEEWRELNTRWYQFGAFCPLFRVHGQFPYREVFNIAPKNHPAYQSMLFYDRLRYRLMPYIYTLAGKTFHEDYTVMRALPMDFAEDMAVANIGDQFMFGPAFMVAPMYTYKATSRQVYLPKTNGWYDFYTGKYFDGGQRINAPAPYERIPVFVREGSIVPVGPEIQYALEKPADPITLYVYDGKDASFNFYEDEGINFQYEKGAYSVIPITYTESTRTLVIGNRKGSYNGMVRNHLFKIIFVGKDNQTGFNFNPKSPKSIIYNGEMQQIKL